MRLTACPPIVGHRGLPTSRPRQADRQGHQIDLFASSRTLTNTVRIFRDSCFVSGTDHELLQGPLGFDRVLHGRDTLRLRGFGLEGSLKSLRSTRQSLRTLPNITPSSAQGTPTETLKKSGLCSAKRDSSGPQEHGRTPWQPGARGRLMGTGRPTEGLRSHASQVGIRTSLPANRLTRTLLCTGTCPLSTRVQGFLRFPRWEAAAGLSQWKS